MGSLGPPPVPVVDQHGDGSGNSGKTGAEKANYRALKTGDAQMRAQFVRTLAEYSELGGKVNFDDLDTIAAEALASLMPPAPQPIPDPTTDRPPVEPDSRP